ncbi:MAG: type IV pilus twitching motility protein PilT [Acidobacteria bacterium]|nr:type IV pilus twitching motility protein PilT [Acidobacteriota bacterium]
MARIDRFLQALFQSGSERLILASGKPAALASGDRLLPVSKQPVTLPQILDLVREVAPAERREAVAGPGRHEFSYDSPAGSVAVLSVRNNGSVQAEFTPIRPRGAAPGGAGAEIDALFRRMVENNCSDLHMSTGRPPLFRKDGEMVPLGEDPALSGEEVERLLRPIVPARNWKEFETTNDTDFAYELAGVARFRCNAFRDRLGVGGVFRQIPSRIPKAEDLGLSRHIMDLCRLSKGFVLVTGPTGSGKSTTLAAMLSHINETRRDHVITIEDPIEFVYTPGRCLINQREVGLHTTDFKRALRAALREDPDIVLVGEMRDLETVKIALETAETGHLVFATLHTNTAPSTIDRIIDQFPADEQGQVRTMLSESLKGVIAQTLCRRREGGRVAAHEVLLVNSAVANLIREGKTFQIPSIMQTGRGLGMVTMNDALLDLVRKKLIAPEEAYAKSYQRSELRTAFERHGIRWNEKAVEDPGAETTPKPDPSRPAPAGGPAPPPGTARTPAR